MYKIEIIKGNIMNVTGDTVVCSANNDLTKGRGHAQSLFYAAGDELIKECEEIGFCETGNAVCTKGYGSPFKHIIHAAGPYWHGGCDNEAEKLASCYFQIMTKAKEINSETVVIPAICTGRGKYPINEAAKIAVFTIKNFLFKNPDYSPVIKFMCYNPETLLAYRQANTNINLRINQFFNRKKIYLSIKMSKDEKEFATLRPFRRTLTKEQKRELSNEVLKYSLNKCVPEAVFLSEIKSNEINEDVCRRYKTVGPFVTLDAVEDVSVTGDYIDFCISPVVFTKEDIKGEIDNYLFHKEIIKKANIKKEDFDYKNAEIMQIKE